MSNSLLNCSTPGFPVLHHFPEFAWTHIHWVSAALQPSQPLLSSSPLALNISQHQGLFPVSWLFTSGGQRIGASASVLPTSIQGWFLLGLTGLISFLSKRLSRVVPTPQLESINSLALSLLSGPVLTSIHDYWKNHSFDYTNLCWQSDVFAF